MKKTFIPTSFRPQVPGSCLKEVERPPFKIPAERTKSKRIVLLSSREDLVAEQVYLDMKPHYPVVHLYFDDLGYSWEFIFEKERLKFFAGDVEIDPISVYHRHPGIEKKHPHYQKHMAFFEVVDIWKGNIIGQSRDHF